MKRLSAIWTKGKEKRSCIVVGKGDPCISSITFDSRLCRPHCVYIAIKGLHTDGHLYIQEAIERGAVVIVHSDPLPLYIQDIVYIQHVHPRLIASYLSHHLYSPIPSKLIGITGTDGKTTSCEFLWSLVRNVVGSCGLICSTSLDEGLGIQETPYRQSTPEAPLLYPHLQKMRKLNTPYAIVECTSHGLSHKSARLSFLSFCTALYTTITSEHLEFHQDVEHYVDAKLNLARSVLPHGWIICPYHFPYIPHVRNVCHPSVQICTYSLDLIDTEANLQATTLNASLQSRSLLCKLNGHTWEMTIPIGPDFLTENFLGSFLAAYLLCSFPLPPPVSLIDHISQSKGRYQVLKTETPYTIIIDFAHTADALYRLFRFVRKSHPEGNFIVVFGAAGERDTSKRGPMGEIAAQWCSHIILTDEDPRGEDPLSIIKDIATSIHLDQSQSLQMIPNRREALKRAIAVCKPKDVLFVLGKGHEKSIDYGNSSVEWDEEKEIRLALQATTYRTMEEV